MKNQNVVVVVVVVVVLVEVVAMVVVVVAVAAVVKLCLPTLTVNNSHERARMALNTPHTSVMANDDIKLLLSNKCWVTQILPCEV